MKSFPQASRKIKILGVLNLLIPLVLTFPTNPSSENIKGLVEYSLLYLVFLLLSIVLLYKNSLVRIIYKIAVGNAVFLAVFGFGLLFDGLVISEWVFYLMKVLYPAVVIAFILKCNLIGKEEAKSAASSAGGVTMVTLSVVLLVIFVFMLIFVIKLLEAVGMNFN